MTLHYLIHLANYSDGVLYLMAVILMVALAVIIDRSWYLRRTLLQGNSLVERLAATHQATRAQLASLAAAAADLPEAALLDVVARHMGLIGNEQLAYRLDEASLRLAPALDRRLWILDTIVTLAPLLGLFGTIVGMFHAFSVLSAPGHAPTAVTGGIADALVATASGLFVAMTGLLAFNGLNNKVRGILHQLDLVKTMLLNRLDGAPVLLPSSSGEVAGQAAMKHQKTVTAK